ncbi:MAG: hypothetical protein QOI95_1857 [Acidimicrobiaceae bacterium]
MDGWIQSRVGHQDGYPDRTPHDRADNDIARPVRSQIDDAETDPKHSSNATDSNEPRM